MSLMVFISTTVTAAGDEVSGVGSPSCAARLVLRYDDVTGHSDLAIEKELYEQTARLGTTVLVGVVPMLPPDRFEAKLATASESGLDARVNLLKSYAKAKVVEIALHGYRHLDAGQAKNRKSEFSGVALAEQRKWIEEAERWMKATLDVEPWAFIPPWNTYDGSTLQALSESGIDLVSSARSRHVTAAPPGLSFLPGTAYAQQIDQAIAEFEQAGDCQALVVIVMHPFDFEGGAELPAFRHEKQIRMSDLFDRLAELKASGRIELLSAGALLKDGAVDGRRYDANVALSESELIRKRLLPGALAHYPSPKLYYSTEAAHQALLDLRVKALAYFEIAVVLGALFGCALAIYMPRAALAVSSLFIMSSGWLWLGANYAKSATVLLFGLGISLPVLIQKIRVGHSGRDRISTDTVAGDDSIKRLRGSR